MSVPRFPPEQRVSPESAVVTRRIDLPPSVVGGVLERLELLRVSLLDLGVDMLGRLALRDGGQELPRRRRLREEVIRRLLKREHHGRAGSQPPPAAAAPAARARPCRQERDNCLTWDSFPRPSK